MINKANEIYKKSLETIEFNKILDNLSKLCVSEDARELCYSLCLLDKQIKFKKH
jgi:hypothetical protein